MGGIVTTDFGACEAATALVLQPDGKLVEAGIFSAAELDIVLEPGDQLFIPRLPNSVVVAGEVMSPSGIQFKPGRSVAD